MASAEMNRRSFLGFALVAPLVPIVAMESTASKHYLVGERGPEMFFARNVTIDSRTDRDQILADMIKILAENNRRLKL